MRYVSYKLAVNVNVSKMAFAQKIQVRLNREGSIYSNSWQHSQLLRDYVSDLHHPEMELKVPIRDSDFLVVLRLRLRLREARINTSARSTCCFKKQLVNKEIWEPLFIVERLKQANVDIYL